MFIVLSQLLWLLILLVQGISIWHLDRGESRPITLQDLSLALTFGILLELTFFLLNLSPSLHLVLVGLVIITNLATFFKFKPRTLALQFEKFDLICLGVVCFLLLLRTVTYPADAWDTRSIWLFQAKMIFHHGFDGLRALTNPAYAFSHSSYPKLLPLMMAKAAKVTGTWNEYLPMFGVWVLGLLSTLAIISFGKTRFQKIFLLLALIGIPYELIWNGYADGFLVVFTILGILHLSNWVEFSTKSSLLSALLFLCLAANLKDEGKVLMILTLFSFALCNFKKFKTNYKFLILLLTGFVPILLWSLTKSHYNFHSWAGLNADALARLSSRISDTKLLSHLLKDSWLHLWRPLALSLGSLASLFWIVKENPKKKFSSSIHFPILLIFFGYLGVLWLVYLTTPFDPYWHIATSIKRSSLILSLLPAVLFFKFHGKFFRQTAS